MLKGLALIEKYIKDIYLSMLCLNMSLEGIEYGSCFRENPCFDIEGGFDEE